MPTPSSDVQLDKKWFLYMIRCKGGVIYTGITTDVDRRFAQHQAGKGAKFLRGKAPLELVFQKGIGSHSDALKTEASVKKWPKSLKETTIHTGWPY
jgi:putative endonuclease